MVAGGVPGEVDGAVVGGEGLADHTWRVFRKAEAEVPEISVGGVISFLLTDRLGLGESFLGGRRRTEWGLKEGSLPGSQACVGGGIFF